MKKLYILLLGVVTSLYCTAQEATMNNIRVKGNLITEGYSNSEDSIGLGSEYISSWADISPSVVETDPVYAADSTSIKLGLANLEDSITKHTDTLQLHDTRLKALESTSPSGGSIDTITSTTPVSLSSGGYNKVVVYNSSTGRLFVADTIPGSSTTGGGGDIYRSGYPTTLSPAYWVNDSTIGYVANHQITSTSWFINGSFRILSNSSLNLEAVDTLILDATDGVKLKSIAFYQDNDPQTNDRWLPDLGAVKSVISDSIATLKDTAAEHNTRLLALENATPSGSIDTITSTTPADLASGSYTHAVMFNSTTGRLQLADTTSLIPTTGGGDVYKSGSPTAYAPVYWQNDSTIAPLADHQLYSGLWQINENFYISNSDNLYIHSEDSVYIGSPFIGITGPSTFSAKAIFEDTAVVLGPTYMYGDIYADLLKKSDTTWIKVAPDGRLLPGDSIYFASFGLTDEIRPIKDYLNDTVNGELIWKWIDGNGKIWTRRGLGGASIDKAIGMLTWQSEQLLRRNLELTQDIKNLEDRILCLETWKIKIIKLNVFLSLFFIGAFLSILVFMYRAKNIKCDE